MTFSVINYLGAPGISSSDPLQANSLPKVPLGTTVRGVDPTYGEAEFRYVLQVTLQTVGSVVIYDPTTFQSALLTVTNGKNKGVPVGVCMSVPTVGTASYGWVQVSGLATIKKTSVAVTPNVPIFISGTSGRIKVLASAGQQILGAQTANLTTIVTTTSTVVVQIDRPHTQGQIT